MPHRDRLAAPGGRRQNRRMRLRPTLLLLAALALPASVHAQDFVPSETAPGAPTPAPAPGEGPPADGLATGAAVAPPAEMPPPIYEEQLLRLSEILGSLSFLRDLCSETDAAAWPDEMQALLAAEHPTPQRMAKLVGRYNHGFETFNAVYRSCTPSARLAITRYLAEGQSLSEDVRSRYSQ
jgi:uncharacterized protein (TIGR02301 family)